jgi:hypothetical protein
MSRYQCLICNFKAEKGGDYKRHILTKKHKKLSLAHNTDSVSPFIPNYPQLSPIIPNYPHLSLNIHNDTDNKSTQCKYCNKIISTRHIRRHYITVCLDIPENMKIKLIDKHNSNLKTKKKLDIVLYNNSGNKLVNGNNTNTNNNINSNNTNNINSNNTNNIQNNFNINVLGKESISHIPEERIIAILSSGNNVMKEYLTDVYKDNDNVNALINIRTKSIMFINENNELESGEMSDVLGTMADVHFDNICKMYKTHKSKCKPIAQKTFEKVYGGFYNQDYGIEEDEAYIDTSEYNNYDTNIPSILERQIMFKLIDVKYISKDKLGKFKKFNINNTENIMIGIL